MISFIQAPPLDPALAYMSRLIGKWDGVGHVAGQSFKCRATFEWNEDHRGIHALADIAVDSPRPMHSRSWMGWDPVAKQVYYADAHDSDTLYVGHVTLKDDKLLFRFGNYGKGEKEFTSTQWFASNGHFMAEIRDASRPNDAPMVSVEWIRKGQK